MVDETQRLTTHEASRESSMTREVKEEAFTEVKEKAFTEVKEEEAFSSTTRTHESAFTIQESSKLEEKLEEMKLEEVKLHFYEVTSIDCYVRPSISPHDITHLLTSSITVDFDPSKQYLYHSSAPVYYRINVQFLFIAFSVGSFLLDFFNLITSKHSSP